MNSAAPRTGVLLVNLGTPDSPQPRDVRRYLREFLSDPRVLTMPAAARWLLLNLVILPTRPRRSAEAYAKIWRSDGSPLLVHGRALRDAVADELGDGFQVELAMRYGRPDIAGALQRLADGGIERAVLLPLFPQFSQAATGSVLARVAECRERLAPQLGLAEVRDFHDDAGFVSAFAEGARPQLEAFAPDHVLLSYHGLPESQVRAVPGCLASDDCCERPGDRLPDCYRAQCLRTSHALAAALGLAPDGYTTSFQSRLGRARWIEPYTDVVVESLARRGVRRLAVLCPAFVADCLETLEEIGIRLREQWSALGGEAFALCPCPNAHPAWARAAAELVRQRAAGAFRGSAQPR